MGITKQQKVTEKKELRARAPYLYQKGPHFCKSSTGYNPKYAQPINHLNAVFVCEN